MPEKPPEPSVEMQLEAIKAQLGQIVEHGRAVSEMKVMQQDRLLQQMTAMMMQLTTLAHEFAQMARATSSEQAHLAGEAGKLIFQALTLQTEAIKALRADLEGLRERVKALESQ
jgi:chaperonin cofactor prefoldin